MPINADERGARYNALPCTGRQGRAKASSDSAASTSFLPGGRGRRAASKSSRALRARGGLPRRERTERRRPGRPAGLDRAPLPGRSGRSPSVVRRVRKGTMCLLPGSRFSRPVPRSGPLRGGARRARPKARKCRIVPSNVTSECKISQRKARVKRLFDCQNP